MMCDNNVIRPIFGSGRSKSVSDAPTVLAVAVSDNIPDFEQDIDYFISNLERIWKAHLMGDTMTNFLFDDIKYIKTDSSLKLRRPLVRSNTFEQFCDRLLGSTKVEWRAQPAFFGALFIEFHERQNSILLTILESRKEQIRALAAGDQKIILQIVARAEL